jgi:DNA polymerase-3 subunit delta
VIVYPDKLGQSLSRNLDQIYLIAGEESVLVNEAADQIREAAKQAGFTERSVYHADQPGFSWEECLCSLNSLSLFSERKVMEIHFEKNNPKDPHLLEYSEQPDPDTLLIIFSPKINKNSQKAKWFQKLDKASIFIPVWPLDERRLRQWISTHCKRLNINLDQEAVTFLIENTEGNLLALKQELEKLALTCPEAPIDQGTVSASLSNSSSYTVFDLTDMMVRMHTSDCLKILRFLREERIAENQVAWAVAREIHIVHRIMKAIASGSRPNDAMASQGIWQQRQPSYQNIINNQNPGNLERLIARCHELDLSIKGLKELDPWQLLDDIVIRATTP